MTLDCEALTYVEIDINYCANSYGSAPCTAAGSSKCWNTRNTSDDCQDPANFTPSVKTIRLAYPSEHLLAGVDCIPSLSEQVDITPGVMAPGESLGKRWECTVSSRNHPHGDAGLDKYWGERDYIASDRGTYWGRFRARNSFLRGQPMRVYQGFANQDFADFTVYHFVIDNFAGPSAATGIFTLKGVDIFRFLDDGEAQAPAASPGQLAGGIDETVGQVFMLEPAGVGNAHYLSSGYGSIGDEEVAFTRVDDEVTLTQRGIGKSVAESHSAEDAFQQTLVFSPQRVDYIFAALVGGYSSMASENIPVDEWAAELAATEGFNYSARITKPTGLKTLLTELIVQAGLSVWPDIHTNVMKMQVVGQVPQAAEVLDESSFIGGTFDQKDQQEKRVSVMWTFYNQRNPMESLDKQSNYASQSLRVGANSSQYNGAAIKKIYSRWIGQFGGGVADVLNLRKLSRFELPPRKFTGQLSRDKVIAVGDRKRLSFRVLENCDGSVATVPAQVVSIKPGVGRRSVVFEEMLFIDQGEGTKPPLVFSQSEPYYTVNLRGAYDQTFSNLGETDIVDVRIDAATDIGSTTTLPALSILAEDWPAGVVINVYLNRSIVGRGGRGADGNSSNLNGRPGGVALKVTRPVNFICGVNNKIAGGGGGGGATVGHSSGGTVYHAGGGGGAGLPGGAGGVGPYVSGGTIAYSGDGEDGTIVAGGAAGIAAAGGPIYAGRGGDLGQAGQDSQDSGMGGDGGAAGVAIDGYSFITFSGESPNILGAAIN